MNGAGNDFMVMDARGGKYDFEKLAIELCNLTGADGFMAVDARTRPIFVCISTIPTEPGARCAATAPGASAGMPTTWASPERK